MTKEETSLKEDLASNIAYLKNGIGQSSDILFQDFSIGQDKTPAMLILTEGLTETLLISDQVIRPLQHQEFCLKQNLIKCISSSILGIKTDQLRTFSEIGKAVLQGNGVLLVEGYSTGLSIEMKKVQQRSLEDPENESMLRGPKVGFIEELRTNTALIRQRANDPNLTIKEMLVGERNEKKIALLFIKGLTDRELVEDMIKRIRNIKIDDPLESGYIEQLIEDYPYSIFPHVQSTERPDRVVSALLEGKIGILLDGTPFATIAPITFNAILQTPDDYYQRWIPSTLLR
ncbi:spore germination protein, partial [Priestia megaterium]|uniref:spore germination protein n=1 Tax=Priestia megaterium TaxID=1404 RepID=UPI002E1AF8AE